MPQYHYTAKSQPGKSITGTIEAESEHEALIRLNKQGFFPMSLHAEDILEKRGFLSFNRLTHKDITLFTRQLSTLLESGVNIINGLTILLNQTAKKSLKAVIADLISKIKDGKSLSDSLKLHPYCFSKLYVSMVHSGEASGTIELTLRRLADFLEKEEDFRNSLTAALTYPFFLLSVSALTVCILMGFVIPRLVTMFEDMGQALPLPTFLLITLSNFLRSYWWAGIIVFAVLFLLSRRYAATIKGKKTIHAAILRIPLAGNVTLNTEISRFLRTLALSLSSGIPIIQAIEVTATVIENQILSDDVEGFLKKLSQGIPFSLCLKESKLFPVFVTNIVSIGEETGTLEKSLLRICDEYEKEVDLTLKTFARLLEPAIILIMGLIVGFIVLSMLLPIFQINMLVS